jgi:hypothetical protein
LLFTLVFIKYNVKENNTNLRQTVAEQGEATRTNLTTNMPPEDNNITPCEKYIMDKMVERGLTIEQPANTPQPGTINTSLNLAPPLAISTSTQLVG